MSSVFRNYSTPTPQASNPSRQRGITVFIALIALVALTVAGIALVRSVDTGNLIAGNFAFKQAALQATDAGIEAAFNQVPTIANLDTLIENQYYPVMLPLDENGIPSTVDWDLVPTQNVAGYTVGYVIERLCSGTLPITDTQTNCVANQTQSLGSKKQGGPVFPSSSGLNYRVTVRVQGPRNTISMAQAILAF